VHGSFLNLAWLSRIYGAGLAGFYQGLSAEEEIKGR